MNITEIIKSTATVLSSVLLIAGFIAAVYKPIRKKIINWIIGASGVPTCNNEIEQLINGFNKMQKALEENIKQSETERKQTLEALNEVNQKLDSTVEIQRNNCRNILTDIWYKYGKYGEIPRYKYDLFIKTYADYKDNLHGNSFVDDIHNKMQDIKIID